MPAKGLLITGVQPDSIADELNLSPGDRLFAINGQPIRDIIDYRFLVGEEKLLVTVLKGDKEKWLLDIEKDYDENLGLEFGENAFGQIKRCSNRCLFCFIEQMPPGLRDTLYIKDDDYRLSFWQGNFVTLTNLSGNEIERIVRQRLSPLYISVHATDPDLRIQIMGNPRAGKILEQMRYLADHGIVMHAQVVLCPGINDGAQLVKTVDDLSGLWPALRSVALVPVGLTKFRENLFPLKSYGPRQAKRIVKWVLEKEKDFLARFGNPLLFASDEFFLLAGLAIPSAEHYAGFPQLENGVGVVRLFLDEWARAVKALPVSVPVKKKFIVVTGVIAEGIMRRVVSALNRVAGLEVELAVVKNRFFGEKVTVAGLLTGKDLLDYFQGRFVPGEIILPSVLLKENESVFLDGMSLENLAAMLKRTVLVASGPKELVACVLGSEVTAKEGEL